MTYVTSSLRCCVDTCKSIGSSNQQLTFFSFPRNRNRCKAWLENIPKIFIDKDHPVSTKDLKICAKHFTEDVFNNSTKHVLIPIAVPTIFKNIDVEDIIENDSKFDIEKHDPFAQEGIPNDEKDPLFEAVLKDPCREILPKVVNTDPGLQAGNFKGTNNNLIDSYIIKDGLRINKETQTSNIRTYGNKIIYRNIQTQTSTQTNSLKLKDKNDLVQFRVQDFYKICRICYTDNISILIDIFNSKCKETNFASILNYNNNEQNIILSRFICKNCTEQMIQYHNFGKQIEESTEILTTIYKNLTESKIMRIMCMPKSSSLLTLEDCQYQCYSQSIEEQPVLIMDLDRIKNIENDIKNNIENNDSTDLQEEDYNSLEEDGDIVLKKITLNQIETDAERIKQNNYTILNESSEAAVENESEEKSVLNSVATPLNKPNRDMYTRPPPKLPIYTEEEQLQRRTCPKCNKVYSSYNAMKIHQHRQHSNKRKYPKPSKPPRYTAEEQLQRRTCPLCNKVCSNRAAYRAHKSKMHTRPQKPRLSKYTEEQQLQRRTCATCDKVFKNNRHLVLHNREMHVYVNCEICQVCIRKHSRRVHMRQVHDVVEVKVPESSLCVKCGKSVRKDNYRKHLQTHLETKSFTCDLCEFRTKFKSCLTLHTRLHAEKKFLCPACGRGFHRNDYLKFHLASHKTLDEPIKCRTCPENFQTLFDRQTHNRNVHGHMETGGSRSFQNRNGQPMKSARNRVCPICQKVCNSYQSWYRHRRSHHCFDHDTKEVCEICMRSYINAQELKIHMRTHSGEKPYTCEKCDKRFASHSHRLSHIRWIHEKKRAFKCAICEKAFNSKYCLREHLRTHTGERLHCAHCDKTCSNRTNFSKHLRQVHNIRMRPPRQRPC